MITMKEYATRRYEIMQKMERPSIAILPAAKEKIRNGDTVFPFRQDSYFYYLTGLIEPHTVAIIVPRKMGGEYILFAPADCPEKTRWTGKQLLDEHKARECFLVDQFFLLDELPTQLSLLLRDKQFIYYPMNLFHEFERDLLQTIHQVRKQYPYPTTLVDITPLLNEMRLIKSKAEIALIQKAVDITASGYLTIMQESHVAQSESRLEATLLYQFHSHDARTVAYPAIVGSGSNSCILHYTHNDKVMHEGELVLVDAGAEYDNYAADITRTFPVNGRFSDHQRLVYALVLKAQLAAISCIKPGVTWDTAQKVIVEILIEGLLELGILTGKAEALIMDKAYLPFYMHQSGHWLGLDVHDVGNYQVKPQQWRVLEPNMVLTVEPGLYLSADIPGLAQEWHNIGVRIEDTVLVTEADPIVLSESIPKQIEDIERMMSK